MLGLAGGEATLTNWDLVYKHQVHVIGFNIGVLIQTSPQIFGEIMRELFALIAAGVLTPGHPTVYKLADGQKALAALEARASVGKLALQPLHGRVERQTCPAVSRICLGQRRRNDRRPGMWYRQPARCCGDVFPKRKVDRRRSVACAAWQGAWAP